MKQLMQHKMFGLRASVGEYFEGYYDLTIHFQDKNLILKYSLDGDSAEKQLSDKNITAFINRLKVMDLLN